MKSQFWRRGGLARERPETRADDLLRTEGLDIGCEMGTTVVPECTVKTTGFTGEIKWVELKAGEDDHSHLIDPDELVQMLMSKQ